MACVVLPKGAIFSLAILFLAAQVAGCIGPDGRQTSGADVVTNLDSIKDDGDRAIIEDQGRSPANNS